MVGNTVLFIPKISWGFYGAQNEMYIEGWTEKGLNLLIYKRLCNI